MGHATIEMTLRYSQLSPEGRRGAVQLLDRSYWLLSPSEENRVSRRPSVVVTQPIEDRVRDDTTICLGCSRHGLFLPKALVWPSLVEEADVLRDEAQQMVRPKQ